MNEELKIIIKAVTKDAKNELGKVSKELEGLSGSAKGASGKVGVAMKGIGVAAAAAVAAVAAIGAALVALGKRSLEVQRQQAKLNTAFQAAGASAEQAAETYNGLYRFLGDSSKAAEAANHLAMITTNQKDLAEWTKISQGIYATFGDSLPIEGLTEAANETLRVGKVTGTLADALNWAGVSEDEFNAKLAATSSLEEREALLRSTLNGLYSNAADIYERNNSALIAYNESQARLDTTMAKAGAATMPLLTALNNLGSAFFNALTPAINAIIPPIATFINWIAKAIQSVLSFFSALTGKSSTVKAVGEIGKSMAGAATGAQKLGSNMGAAEKAAGGAAKAAEEAKKSTQGFDELNIVSSGKNASGGSGGSGGGGGSSSPGYASGGGLLDAATFGTEVEETEGAANSLAETLKNVFGGLAEDLAPSIEAWSGAFDTVKQAWINAKPDFINGATEINSAFSTLGGYLIDEFVPDVTNSFSVNLAPILGDLAGFTLEEAGKHFSWFGEAANTATNDLIIPALGSIKTVATDIFDILGTAWEDKGGGFLTEASKAFDNIRDHIDKFYDATFKPVFDSVKDTFDDVWKNGLKPLYDNFVNSFLTIGTELLILYNDTLAPIVDWVIDNVFPEITNVIQGIIETFGELIKDISDGISGVIDVIEGIIVFLVGVFTLDWEKAWEGITTAFDGVRQVFDSIIQLITDAFTGVCNHIGNVFTGAWNVIEEVWEVVSDWFQENVWDKIADVFKDVETWFETKFTAAWTKIKDVFKTVKEWFTSDVWNKITEVFDKAHEWFETKFKDAWGKIKDVFKDVKTWFTDSVWAKVKEAFGLTDDVKNWFKDKFKGALQAVKDVFTSPTEGIKVFFEGLWGDIKTTFTSLGANIGNAIGGAVKEGINGVISMIENTINSAIGLINGAINLINKIPGVSVSKVSKLTLPRLAKGGVVDSATVAMIGEAGKEAVVPLENNTEWMDKLAERLAARSQTPTKVILKVGEKELGWATIGAINGITEQTGGLQLAL